jgi:hypothetical protein
MSRIYTIKRRDWLTLLLILFIAGLLRFGQAGIVDYFHDDAMVVTLAQEMATGERLHLIGINASLGIPNPPTSIYALLPAFLLTPDPMLALYYVMALNVLGVAVLWLLTQRYFGPMVALLAGLTYAVMPWAVFYSRKIWAQDYHTPFVLLALLLGLYGLWEQQPKTWRSGRFWAQVLCLPILLFGLQIHFAAWALLPLYALLLFVGRRNIAWPALIISGVLALLVMLPYGLGLMQTLQSDPQRIDNALEYSDTRSAEALLTPDPIRYSFYMLTGYGLETWVAPGPENEAEMRQAVPTLGIWLLLLPLALIGAGIGLRSKRHLTLLVLLWGLLPVLALLPGWTPVYPHYFVASIPAFALLIALGVDWVGGVVPLKHTGRTIILGAFAVLLLTQAIWWRGALRYLDSTHIDYPGFTTPLHDLLDIRDELTAYDDVVVLSYGMAWNLHHESVVWPTLLRGQVPCVRTIVGSGYAVLPDGPFAVLEAPDAPADPVLSLYATDDPQAFPERPGGAAYALHTWDAPPEWTHSLITAIEPATFDNGVTLTGYHLGSVADSENREIVLEWRLPQGQRGQDYQYTAQFRDANGQQVGQVDRVFWHGRHWCAGDRLLTWTPVDLADDAASVHVGLYQFGDASTPYISADVLDELGNPVGQQVTITLQD